MGSETIITLFYRNPPRTLIYKDSADVRNLDALHPAWFSSFEEVANINAIPRSTARQVFSQGPMPPPWPITIPANDAAAFGAPDLPTPSGPLSPTEFSSSYASTSNEIRAGVTEIREGRSYDRASKAFTRLNPASKLPGFSWNLVVFRSPENLAFSVPDGTIFLSDHLIERLNDDELAAIIAHLLAHEAYGHDRTFWAEASLIERAAVVTGGTLLLLAVGGLLLAGAGELQSCACWWAVPADGELYSLFT